MLPSQVRFFHACMHACMVHCISQPKLHAHTFYHPSPLLSLVLFPSQFPPPKAASLLPHDACSHGNPPASSHTHPPLPPPCQLLPPRACWRMLSRSWAGPSSSTSSPSRHSITREATRQELSLMCRCVRMFFWLLLEVGLLVWVLMLPPVIPS